MVQNNSKRKEVTKLPQRQKEACKILGVSIYATKEEIKKAYRNLCKMYHPDKNSAPEAKRIYLEVQQAYKYLLQQEIQEKQPKIFYYQAPQTAASQNNKIIGGSQREREQRILREEAARKLRQERLKRLKEQEEKKQQELERRLAARKLPSEREAEKRKKIAVQKEAERIAGIIQTLMNLEIK